MFIRAHITRLHVERLLFLKANVLSLLRRAVTERTSSLVDQCSCLEKYQTFDARPTHDSGWLTVFAQPTLFGRMWMDCSACYSAEQNTNRIFGTALVLWCAALLIIFAEIIIKRSDVRPCIHTFVHLVSSFSKCSETVSETWYVYFMGLEIQLQWSRILNFGPCPCAVGATQTKPDFVNADDDVNKQWIFTEKKETAICQFGCTLKNQESGN